MFDLVSSGGTSDNPKTARERVAAYLNEIWFPVGFPALTDLQNVNECDRARRGARRVPRPRRRIEQSTSAWLLPLCRNRSNPYRGRCDNRPPSLRCGGSAGAALFAFPATTTVVRRCRSARTRRGGARIAYGAGDTPRARPDDGIRPHESKHCLWPHRPF